MMQLTGSLGRVVNLSSQDRDQLFDLMDRHYENVGRHTFESDLAEKRWTIQLRSSDSGEVCGFSTQMLLDASVDGRPVKALFSGDTIIDPSYWGDSALMRVFGQLCLSLIEEFAHDELYWFLISAGYKTYRFLPVFFRQFYPRFDERTPPRIERVIESFSMQRFADRYEAGVVRADAQQYRLREGVAEVTPHRLKDPHVRFFVERNPGHIRGDELCCLAPLSRENFTDAAYRVIGVEHEQLPPESAAKTLSE